MSNFVDEIRLGHEVRQNLIQLKNEIKDAKQKKALAYYLAGDFSVFTELLRHDDPKIRKNAVLILGDMECDDLVEEIWETYQQETTLFIRADYLKALRNYDCSGFVKDMKERMKELNRTEHLPEEEKHIRSEYQALLAITAQYDKREKHAFCGWNEAQEIILLTNRNHRETTADMVEADDVRMLAGGIRFTARDLKKVMEIRTWSEMLFPLSATASVGGNMQQMARQLLQYGLIDFLKRNHKGDTPFYFRIDVRAKIDPDTRTEIMKKVAIQLESLSGRALINTPSDYEIEIRLVASRDGKFVPLLKLFTIPDNRFYYRKEYLPTSIAPSNAALMMEIAKEHLTPHAQVIDPFCGVGTMLIERQRAMQVGSMYGLDILAEAVEKARINTKLSGATVNYINRNFFDFKHDYLFDELITNMPGAGRNRSEEDMRFFYNRFLEKAGEVLKKDGILILYHSMRDLFRQCLRTHSDFRLLKESCLNERDESYVYVLKYQGK